MIKLMAELDTIKLSNPTSEDFIQNFNGEPYTVKAGQSKSFAQFVGFHIAKHLATKMVLSTFSKKDRNDPKKAISIGQHTHYDNPKLRIALYQIFGDKDLVQKTILLYPYKGFIGEMDEYKNFVEKSEKKSEK